MPLETLARCTRRKPLTSFVAVILCGAGLALAACSGPSAGNGNEPAGSPSPVPTQSAAPREFDRLRAYDHVKQQTDIGPRPAGSAELGRAREYIVSALKSGGLSVTMDEFHTATPIGERTMANITAELAGESSDVIMISSHYDTKLFKEFRFVGANDGASSTAVVMELARALAARKVKPKFTYWFVFFDGEEAFCDDWNECGKPGRPDNTYGSRRFVAQLKQRNEVARVRAMILLDMVGYRYLSFAREANSTRWLTDVIWNAARELGHGRVFSDMEEGIEDDHMAFLVAGIESVDVIQLSSYPYWHRADDMLDKVSAESLGIVGDVVLRSLPKIEERIASRPQP